MLSNQQTRPNGLFAIFSVVPILVFASKLALQIPSWQIQTPAEAFFLNEEVSNKRYSWLSQGNLIPRFLHLIPMFFDHYFYLTRIILLLWWRFYIFVFQIQCTVWMTQTWTPCAFNFVKIFLFVEIQWAFGPYLQNGMEFCN